MLDRRSNCFSQWVNLTWRPCIYIYILLWRVLWHDRSSVVPHHLSLLSDKFNWRALYANRAWFLSKTSTFVEYRRIRHRKTKKKKKTILECVVSSSFRVTVAVRFGSCLGVRRGWIQQTPNVAFEFGRLWTKVTTGCGCGIVIFGGSAKFGERRRRDVALEKRESPWPWVRKDSRDFLVRTVFFPSFFFFFFFFKRQLLSPKGCWRARDSGSSRANNATTLKEICSWYSRIDSRDRTVRRK